MKLNADLKITIILLVTISCQSQTINLKDWRGDIAIGAYYKDIDNELNQFAGTYQLLGNNGLDEMTIVFKKFVNYYNSKFYQDILVGEMKYKKDGVLYFDNLNKINENYQYKHKHDIAGNSLIANQTRPVCNDCSPNQYRADLIFYGRNNNNHCGGDLILRKFIENGQEKIKASFYFHPAGQVEGEPENPKSYFPGGDYILTKLP